MTRPHAPTALDPLDLYAALSEAAASARFAATIAYTTESCPPGTKPMGFSEARERMQKAIAALDRFEERARA